VRSVEEAARVAGVAGPLAVDVVARSDSEADRLVRSLAREGRRIYEISESILVTEPADLERLALLLADDLTVSVDLELVRSERSRYDDAILGLVLSHHWGLFCLAADVYAVTPRASGPDSVGDREPRRPVTPLLSGAVELPIRRAS
jgi:hypothetical protein